MKTKTSNTLFFMEFFESCLLQERGLALEVKTSKHNFQIFTTNSN